MHTIILTLVALTSGRILIAFGDWGDVNYRPRIQKLNQYIRNESRSDAVLLLGDNFYPDGIRPSVKFLDPRLLLFTRTLAQNISSDFVAVLGNHDYLTKGSAEFQMTYSKIDPRWYLPGPLYSRRYSVGPGLFTCIYGIDSIQFSFDYAKKLSEYIEKDLQRCVWIILMSHYPVYTFGTYYAATSVERFRALIEPVLEKHKSRISLVLSGHEHSTQIISKGPNSPLFVVVGGSVEVRRDSIMNKIKHIVDGVKLIYHNDKSPGIVARIVHTHIFLKLELVDVKTGTVLIKKARFRRISRLIR